MRCVKQFPTVNRVNMFWGESYNNQESPNILHSKVLATCVAILGAQPNTIHLINEMVYMPVNRDWIRAKNRAAHNIKSHQLEQHFTTNLVRGTFHDTVFNSDLILHYQWHCKCISSTMNSSSSVCPPDKMMSSFPESALPKITPEPHCESLVELRDALKGNYSLIPSRRGGGTYCYLWCLQPYAVYAIIAPGTAFFIPPYTGPLIIPSGTHIVTSGNLQCNHAESAREFKEWINLERAGKKTNRGSSEQNISGRSIWPQFGIRPSRVRYIIAHLFTEYGQVEYQDLVGNRSKLSEPWVANRPFQELVQRVQEIQEFANDGGRTISDEDIFDTTYKLVFNTGLFYDNWDKWDDKQQDKKTWANFQAHFQAAQRKYKWKQKVLTSAGGYHGANNLR